MKRVLIFSICLCLTLAFGVGNVFTPEIKAGSDEMQPYPRCKGPRKRLAVYRFKDGVNNNLSKPIMKGLQEALEQELQQSGCFMILVTGDDMDDAATEIRHGQSGMARDGRSPQAGKQFGAQIIVQGVLYEVAYTGGKSGGVKVPKKIGGGIGGSVGISKQEAKVVIMVKMFDPETRQLLFSERAEGHIVKQKVSAGVNVQGVKAGGSLDKETPLGDAALRAIHDTVRITIKKMNKTKWQSVILKATGSQIIIRGGKKDGLKPGMILIVLKPGEKLEDPETGEILQEPPTRIGQAQITKVTEKMSYANMISGPAMKGMYVRVQKKKKGSGTQ